MSLFAALVLACLYSTSHAHHEYGLQVEDRCATPTTYTIITPSPDAAPYPVTAQGQKVTSWSPQYAVCNPDNSDCTTIYSASVYAWCSTVIPCYPSSCTVTDYAQPVTFSHANSYQLQTAVYAAGEHTIHGTLTTVSVPATTVYYVEPIVTRYSLSYADYAEGNYGDVGVERCVELYPGKAVCEVYVEHWVEEVQVKEVVVVLPVTVHTYCPEPTTVSWGERTVVVGDTPTTYTFVTEKTETVTVVETETRRWSSSSSTSTLTSTVTVVVPEVTVKPEATTSCETSSSSEIALKQTTAEYTETTTITTDCPESSSTTSAKLVTPAYSAALEYHTLSIDSTSTETATETLTVTLHTESYASIETALATNYPGAESEYSTPQRREVPNTSSHYPAPQSKYQTYSNHTSGSFAAYRAHHEAKHTGEIHEYGEYADESKEDEQSKAGALTTEHIVEPREYTTYAYSESGAGTADGQGHSYGRYGDHAESYEFSNSGAGGGYSKPEPVPVAADLEERDEYYYEAAGAGRADGQRHSYGEYADYSNEYKYGEGGAGATYDVTTADAPEYKTVEERDRYSAYAYEASGAGKADGQKHSYGEYADYSREYKYSQDGAGATYDVPTAAVPTEYGTVEERDHYAAYAYETSGSAEASGEAHSYGQYADHTEAAQHGTAGAGAGYPIHHPAHVAADLEERDEFSLANAGAGKASGEAHSYGQYADYSSEYEYGQGASLSESDGAYGSYGSATAKASGVYSHEAAGERHSYGQYQDYEEGVRHEYENEAARKVGGYGGDGYSYGARVEGEEE